MAAVLSSIVWQVDQPNSYIVGVLLLLQMAGKSSFVISACEGLCLGPRSSS